MLDNIIMQVYDGLESNTRCPHHSSRYPDFCMSAIKVAIYNNICNNYNIYNIYNINSQEDHVDLAHAAVCAAETGHVYVVAPTNNGDKAEVAGGGAAAGAGYKYFHHLTLDQYLHVISSELREVTRDTCQTGTRATRSSWWRRLETARGYTPSPRASRCV